MVKRQLMSLKAKAILLRAKCTAEFLTNGRSSVKKGLQLFCFLMDERPLVKNSAVHLALYTSLISYVMDTLLVEGNSD